MSYSHGNYDKTYTVIAENQLGCSNTVTAGWFNVKVFKAVTGFSVSDLFYVNDSIGVINHSNVDQYDWTINGVKFNEKEVPKQSFSTPGTYNFELIGNSRFGCSDTANKKVKIVNKAPNFSNSTCFIDTLNETLETSYYGNADRNSTFKTHVDKKGNLYTYGSNFFTYGGGYGHSFGWFLEKFNNEGKSIWSKQQDAMDYSDRNEYYSTFINAMDSDEDGNLYLTGSYAAEYLQTGPHVIFHNSNIGVHSFIMKLNSDGDVVWFYFCTDEYNSTTERGGADIKLIDGKLFVSIVNPREMEDLKGNSLGLAILGRGSKNGILEMTVDGELINEYLINEVPPGGANNSGLISLFNPYSSSYDSRQTVIASPLINDLGNGKVAVTGFFKSSMKFGSITVDPITNCKSEFTAILNPETGEWEKAFSNTGVHHLNNLKMAPVVTVDGAQNIVSALTSTFYAYWSKTDNVIHLNSGEVYEDNLEAVTIIKSANQSNSIVWKKIIRNGFVRTLDYDEQSNTIIAYGKSKLGLAFQLSDESIGIKGSEQYDNFILVLDASTGAVVSATILKSNDQDLPLFANLDDCGNYWVIGSREEQDAPSTTYFNGDSIDTELQDKYLIRIPVTSLTCSNDCFEPIYSKEYKEKNTTKIYPNPTTGISRIVGVTDVNLVTVFNEVGQVVLTKRQDFQTLNLSQLPVGLYYVEVQTKESITTQKVLRIK